MVHIREFYDEGEALEAAGLSEVVALDEKQRFCFAWKAAV